MYYFSCMKTITNAEAFCLEIIEQDIPRSRALANLVMALASYTSAHSVTELSLSPVYHYQFSSISNAVSELAADSSEHDAVRQELQSLVLKYFEFPEELVLIGDKTPVCKPASPTLKERTYVHISNNPVSSNSPVSVGYEYSHFHLCPGSDSYTIP